MRQPLVGRNYELRPFPRIVSRRTTSRRVSRGGRGAVEIRREKQLNPVADEVLALTSVVRPILSGVLNALKADVVKEVGGYENVKLKLLHRAVVWVIISRFRSAVFYCC